MYLKTHFQRKITGKIRVKFLEEDLRSLNNCKCLSSIMINYFKIDKLLVNAHIKIYKYKHVNAELYTSVRLRFLRRIEILIVTLRK